MRRTRVRGCSTHLGLQSQDTMRERPREKDRDQGRERERGQGTAKAERHKGEKEKVIQMLMAGNLVR